MRSLDPDCCTCCMAYAIMLAGCSLLSALPSEGRRQSARYPHRLAAELPNDERLMLHGSDPQPVALLALHVHNSLWF